MMDFPMHSNTNNKDISTSESAIPRNQAVSGKLQLVDGVASKMVRVSISGRHIRFAPKTTS